jgi:hypothetical protein
VGHICSGPFLPLFPSLGVWASQEIHAAQTRQTTDAIEAIRGLGALGAVAVGASSLSSTTRPNPDLGKSGLEGTIAVNQKPSRAAQDAIPLDLLEGLITPDPIPSQFW